jgi:hypothetical protein
MARRRACLCFLIAGSFWLCANAFILRDVILKFAYVCLCVYVAKAIVFIFTFVLNFFIRVPLFLVSAAHI